MISLNKRKPAGEDLKRAELILTQPDRSLKEKIFSEEIVKLANDPEKTREVEVQAIRIGDLSITGLPGEVFTEFGLKIKSKSPFVYNMISSLTNGLNGYIPTREAFYQGGYEPTLSTYTCLEQEAGDKMTEKAYELLQKLKKQNSNYKNLTG